MERGDDRLAAPAGAAVKHFQGKVDGGGTIAFDVQFKNGNPKTASEFAFSRIPVTCDDRSGRINFAYHGSAQVSDGKFSYRFSSFKASFHGKLNDKGTKASGKVSYGPNELSGHPNCSTGGPARLDGVAIGAEGFMKAAKTRSSRATRILTAVGTMALTMMVSAVALASGGSLGFIGADVNGEGGVRGLSYPIATAVSPDGKNVYAASDSVTVFSRNSTTGALRFVETETRGGGSSDVTVSPDGKSVYASTSDSVAVYSRNVASGALSFVESESPKGFPPVPQGLAVSPDGKHVYVSEYEGNNQYGYGGVLVYSRNSTNGALTFVENHEGPALDGAESVAISPDRKSVYVPAYEADALNVFSRNATTGKLTPVEVKKGGANGLAQASDAVASRDGKNVYVASAYRGTVATFARNSSTSRLQFRGSTSTGSGHLGIHGAKDLAISPDDTNVYVANGDFQAMAVFSRSRTTGALNLGGAVEFGDPAVDLRQFWGPSVSPDGKNVYVADLTGNAVGTFVRNPPPFRLTLKAKAKQSADKLAVDAECSLGCNLSGTAHVKVGKAKYSSHKVKETLPGLAPTELKIEFSPGTLKAIRSQLKRHSGTATIRMNARGGNTDKTEEVTVQLRR